MSEINKPEQIIVNKLTLKQVPAQQEYAQQSTSRPLFSSDYFSFVICSSINFLTSSSLLCSQALALSSSDNG